MRIRFSLNRDQVCFILLFTLLFSGIYGCSRSQDEIPVVPPATHPLAREYIGYGVVNVTFTHLLHEAGSAGISLGYLRRGTMVRIIERKPVIGRGNSESWVLAEGNYQGQGGALKGWLQETTIDVFDNESRAITASNMMNL